MPENTLNVFSNNEMVGVISRDADGRMSFRYSQSWLDDPDAFSISVSLPRQQEVFPPERAHSFFANLLPESGVREHVTRKLGISTDNDFELLARVGGECAGALWIGPGEQPPPEEQKYELITDEKLHELISASGVYSAVVGTGRVRLSLAGAQDKLPVRVMDGSIMLPEPSAPSTHILKFPSKEYRDLPSNEVLVSGLARSLGLRVVDTHIHMVQDIPTCVVTRYDRLGDGTGYLRRLHQEDMCQAMNLPSILKYQKEGGPSFQACLEMVDRVCSEPGVERDQLVRWLIFNLLVGNSDAHGKNLSLLYHEDGSVSLAPFYDLVCTLCYPGIDHALAMPIGGRSEPGMVGPRHFDMLAEECGMRARWLRDYVLRMAESAYSVMESGVGPLGVEPKMVRGVTPAIREQIRVIRNAFRQAAK